MEPSSDDQQTLEDQQPPAAEAETMAEEEDDEEEEESNEEDAIVAKAQGLMDKITYSPDNPNPDVLHALSCILETQEIRYMEETGHSSLNNARGSHSIGRLGNLIRENDEFFELISVKFLSESRYPVSVQAATTRLLFSCSLTWMYPHVFEDHVMENLKAWAMEETSRSSGEVPKQESVQKKSTDSEMLRTYSTGLLAVCLAGGGPVVEDVLTSGLSVKLMRYLRVRALGEIIQKEVHTENKNAGSAISLRGRDEGRGKFRQTLENSHVDGPKFQEEGTLDNQSIELNEDRRQTHAEESPLLGEEPPDGQADLCMSEDVNNFVEDRRNNIDSRDGKSKIYEKHYQARTGRSRGKGKLNEFIPENEPTLNSPGSAIRSGAHGRGTKDRGLNKYSDVKRVVDSKEGPDNFATEREDDDECFQDCKVGSKDISDLVKKAVQVAEAEAKAANAPVEAVKAAGDAAAEAVKTAALEELNKSNDEDAAVLAASIAVSTVVDAANAIEVSRSSTRAEDDPVHLKESEPDSKEEAEEFYILDSDSLAKLREKFSIQCLVFLGEYVEVFAPIMREKGVDVALVLLQQSSKHTEASKIALLLPDVLKLICTLAAHRKFAALFVDRGGMQRLLSVPRVSQIFFGLSSCLFTLGSLQVIMERVCALPSDVVHQVVELALQLLDCPQDQARKNAALFLSNAFVFKAVLDSFDAQDGLQKALSILHDAALVRAGVNAGALPSSSSGSHRNDRSPSEVLTSSEKQVAYHTCIALRQYFRAQLVLIVDSLRPNKSNRNALKNTATVNKASNKPLDISNEAMDAIFQLIQKDRKLGPAFVRARWVAVDKFLTYSGHIIMLELCQAPTVDRYLHDLLQYALGILFIVTLVPYSRKPVVNASLSNDRVGISVILDAANGAGFVDPEITQPALNVLVNLVCPPPSISNKPSMFSQGQQPASVQTSNGSAMQNEPRDRDGESSALDRSGTTSVVNTPQTPVASGLVGDRRISLRSGAGCAGMAAQLEQGYHQAREAVRANNGIKVLLQLLQPRIVTPPASLDCLRALACRVLLGLARDDTIAHILTKLQVGKKLSELIRDSSNQTSGNESSRWQAELGQVAIELIAIVTNSGRASTLAATDAATSTLRRIERAAIAAATPITYHSKELLQLMHEHLVASGLSETASTLLKEAQITPLPSTAAMSSQVHHSSVQEAPSVQIQWPSGRLPGGFLSNKSKKPNLRDNDPGPKYDVEMSYLKKKPLSLSSVKSFSSKTHSQMHDSSPVSSSKNGCLSKTPSVYSGTPEPPLNPNSDLETPLKTPIILPLKRKFTDLKDVVPSAKRLHTSEHAIRSPLCPTPTTARKNSQLTDASGLCTPTFSMKDHYARLIPNTGAPENLDENPHTQNTNQERLTLDSLVVQYLKHQHRQCPAPITTLPPLSLLQPHVCPEPKRCLDAPSNVSARRNTREFRSMYGGIHGNRRDRHFVFSRFRPWRTCRDDNGGLLTCITFLGDSSQIVVGSHAGELKVFDSNTNNMLESCSSHQHPLTFVQSHISNETQLILSSSAHDVRLWDATSVAAGPKHSFEGCKAGRFSHSGTGFAALPNEVTRREILLYDVETCQLDLKLVEMPGSASTRGSIYSLVHFSPSDNMLLWNGVLWDRRSSSPLHRFDQFTDYGGGGFHPAGNEVIINSEVWDLRKFRLLRSVPSLDQTVITFNASGDVIYATLRRNLDDVMSAFNTRRGKHPLFSAFRTVDAVSYSDIATVPVDRAVLDFATDPTDSFVGLVTMDDQSDMYSSARVYEIGRRRPTDDDSDPDDADTEEEEDEDEEDEDDDDSLMGALNGDGDSDMSSNDDDEDGLSGLDDDDDEEDGDFLDGDGDFGGGGYLEIVAEGDEGDDSDEVDSLSSGDDEDFAGFGF